MKKLICSILLIFCFMFNCNNVLAFTEPASINYNETLETFSNPERGFYEPLGLNLKPADNKALNYSSNLVHLRVNIGAFSGKINGSSDLELTEDALTALNITLQNIKAKGGSVIIRFAYEYDGKANLEPSLEMILRHIEQLKSVFYKNRDVITYVELGFFGPWGEMHTSKISTTANVSLAIDKMLESVPEEICIGVRTPNYFAAWAGVERSNLDIFKTKKGTKYYRVGLFNDGYLGSESDLGTFVNREKEIAWINRQAKHTLYGGEVVANFGATPINTVQYMSKEAFLTHTTYLNLRWNYDTINNRKNEIYNGEDSLYVGQTGFKYIDNHLGYRFVLKNSNLSDTITNKDKLMVNFDVENVGFANLINKKKVTIVLENEDNIYEIATTIDPNLWESKGIASIKSNIKLPNDIALGKYRVYLRISYYGNLTNDNNYKTIRLANDGIWNSEIGANYIGKVNIIEYVPPKPEEVKPDSKPEEVKPDPKPDDDIIDEQEHEQPKEEESNIKKEEKDEDKNKKDDSNLTSNEEKNDKDKNKVDNSSSTSNEKENEEQKEEEKKEEQNKTDESETNSSENKDKTETKKKNNILLYIIGVIIGVIIIFLVNKIILNRISKQ